MDELVNFAQTSQLKSLCYAKLAPGVAFRRFLVDFDPISTRNWAIFPIFRRVRGPFRPTLLGKVYEGRRRIDPTRLVRESFEIPSGPAARSTGPEPRRGLASSWKTRGGLARSAPSALRTVRDWLRLGKIPPGFVGWVEPRESPPARIFRRGSTEVRSVRLDRSPFVIESPVEIGFVLENRSLTDEDGE
jgi:hypothetical protein